MKYIFYIVAMVSCASPAYSEPPAKFDQRVEKLREQFGVPGVSIAIVENGRTSLARGYGVRDKSNPQPVDGDTIFPTASTGKAFTAAALAILVDQNKIKWDDKVIDHMPDFRMWDSWVTREMTIRDLLVHRSGLGPGAGDLLFVPRSDLSRRETVRRLRYIRPATSFRGAYAYDNVLYMVAGQLIEEVTGKTWEAFVKANIFEPAGMSRSTVDDLERLAVTNRARPHARLDGAIRGLGTQEPLDEMADRAPNAGPAGSLAISANDMARWLKIQLAHGKIADGPGTQLFSEAASAEMWNPVTITPIAPRPEALKATQPKFQAYALGWGVLDYRGHKIITHPGAIFGALATVVLVPDQNVGFSIAANSEEGELTRGLMYELLDHYLNLPKNSWPEKFHLVNLEQKNAALKSIGTTRAQRAAVGPSLALSRYVGDFSDPWYGVIKIRQNKAKLEVEFPHSPGLRAVLDHWQYDTFRTAFNDKSMEPAFVTFGLNAEGGIDRLTMKALSPLADFSFNYGDLLFTPTKISDAR